MQLQSGTLLHGGSYKIEKVLGQGSFGITYLAEHMSLGKKVAIKEFFMKDLNSRNEDGSITGVSDGSLSYNYAQKFRKEARNLAGLDHPNIVRVTDCFDENGTFYYVMEYIEGQDLNTYVKQHALSESEAISIITDVADALIYMHEEKHMLHLDLKPGNIMRRNSDGHIFLIDFGLSKHYDNNGKPETSTTIGLGTAGYAPTEQGNQAKNGEFRPTIDVYALGATLYKLLTRETPPDASVLVSDDELLQEKLNQYGVSEGLAQVVIKAMMPNVKKRTQSVKEFINLMNKNHSGTKNCEQSIQDADNLLTQEEIVVIDLETQTDLLGTKNISAHDLTEAKELYERAMTFYNNNQYNQAFPLLVQSANMGYAPAQFQTAVSMYWREGIQNPGRNRKEIYADLFRKAAEQGHTESMLWLGEYCYGNGEGVPKDNSQMLYWVEKSANANNHGAQITLGLMYLTGDCVPEDAAKGQRLINSGIDGLLANSDNLTREEMRKIGFCYRYGFGVNEDIEKAIEWYTKASQKGDPEAQNALGNIYLNGYDEIVAEQPERAVKWYKKACQKRLSPALVSLGDCYLNGCGVNENEEEALRYYMIAVEDEFEDAYLRIANCYRNGYGVQKDYSQAAKWYKDAIKKYNNAEAQNALGMLYDEGGHGLTKNQETAVSWFKKAAKQGHVSAQWNYGICLINGEGVAKDEVTGEEWVRKAADNGSPEAINYIEGADTESDTIEPQESDYVDEESQNVYNLAVELVTEQKMSTDAAYQKLVDDGYTPAVVSSVCTQIEEEIKEAKLNQADKDIGWGLLWAIGGAIITYVSHQSASSGGTSRIFFGAIIYGCYRLIHGIWLRMTI